MRPIDDFLFRLQNELERDLGAPLVDEILFETRLHLLERTEALMELGVPEHEAEADSIQAFGNVRVQAKALVRANVPSHEGAVRAVRILSIACCIAGGLTVALCRHWSPALLVPSAFLLIGVVAASYQAGRWDLKGVAKIGLSVSLATWVGMSLLWVRVAGEPGPFELRWRGDVRSQLKDLNKSAAKFEAETNRIAAASAAFRSSEDPLMVALRFDLREGQQILVPTDQLSTETVRFEVPYQAGPAGWAVQQWRTRGDYFTDAARHSAETWRSWAGALEAAVTNGYLANFVRMWMWGAIFIPFGLLPLLLAHAVGVMVAQIKKAVRRWGRVTHA